MDNNAKTMVAVVAAAVLALLGWMYLGTATTTGPATTTSEPAPAPAPAPATPPAAPAQ